MRAVLSFLLFFLLACSGALNSMTPEMPFQLPAETNTTNININTSNGVTTTEVSFVTTSVDTVDLQGDLHEELMADGWAVTSTASNIGPGTLTCTKGDESLVITIEEEGDGAGFHVLWVQ
jgi:hypothetical protein